MSRKATGTVKWCDREPGHVHADRRFDGPHYSARISLVDGARPWHHFDPSPKSPVAETSARHKAEAFTERARRERLTAKDYGMVTQAMSVEAEAAPDMTKWIETWIANRKARGNTTTKDDLSRWTHHIVGAVGGRHVRDWTRDDLRRLSRELDEKIQKGELKWKSAQNIWACAAAICRDACRSKIDKLRVRDDNPLSDVAGPERGVATSKQYLYPSEFAKFIACEDVPVEWRRLVAIAVCTYMRSAELRALQWDDVDFEHGVIHVHQSMGRDGKEKSTKGNDARRVPIEPSLFAFWKAQRDAVDGKGAVLVMPEEQNLAASLRRWLKKAKVERAELHNATPTRKRMTFHDLRATGITWCAIRGDEPLRIKQRAGHKQLSTTEIYVREADNLREGFGEPFPMLPGPEKKTEKPIVPIVRDVSGAPDLAGLDEVSDALVLATPSDPPGIPADRSVPRVFNSRPSHFYSPTTMGYFFAERRRTFRKSTSALSFSGVCVRPE
jgi:integrase